MIAVIYDYISKIYCSAHDPKNGEAQLKSMAEEYAYGNITIRGPEGLVIPPRPPTPVTPTSAYEEKTEEKTEEEEVSIKGPPRASEERRPDEDSCSFVSRGKVIQLSGKEVQTLLHEHSSQLYNITISIRPFDRKAAIEIINRMRDIVNADD